MKKAITLITAILILASCSTKISLVKRKYNKGYFVSVNKKKQINDQLSTVSKTNKAKYLSNQLQKNNEVVAKEVIVNKEVKNESISNTQLKETASVNHLKKHYSTPQLKEVNESNSNKALLSAIKNDYSKKHYFGQAEKKQKADAGTNTLILVILSLFPILCLIAVYLKDGKSITLNFWIDLLLHLTLIGAIVYALLVVLDIYSAA